MVKVLQTWDDGLVSDLRLIEICRRHFAKASFCLNPGLYHEERSYGWHHGGREVRRLSSGELPGVYDGFEICSHSVTHPDLTAISSEQLVWEIKASKEILEQTFSQVVTGFIYPFNAYNDGVKQMVRSAGYRWARGGKHEENIFPPADPWEFHPSCHFLDPDFWEKYDRQRAVNGVFFFWGHSCELVDEQMWRDYEERIRGISLDPEATWRFFRELFP